MGITDTAKWRAVYKDGSILNQMDPDGKEHKFGEIDLPNLDLFQLINAQNIPVCQVRLGEGKRLIWAVRNQLVTGRRLVQQGNVKVPLSIKSHKKVVIIGWQKTIKGVNTKAIFYLLPDGRIEMDDEWRDGGLYDKVNTPGMTPEKNPNAVEADYNKPATENTDPKGKEFSGSNDSEFKNK